MNFTVCNCGFPKGKSHMYSMWKLISVGSKNKFKSSLDNSSNFFPMGVQMHWYKWCAIDHPYLPPLYAHMNVVMMTRLHTYSSSMTFLLKHSNDKCEPWYMIWLNSIVWAMSLGGKEFNSGRVYVYGASLGLLPWVRKEDVTCSSLKWFHIGFVVCPWDPSMKTIVVWLWNLASSGNEAFSSLRQLLSPLPPEQTTTSLYMCMVFY